MILLKSPGSVLVVSLYKVYNMTYLCSEFLFILILGDRRRHMLTGRPRRPYQRRNPEMQRLFSRISAQETLTRAQRIDIARLTNENLALKHDVASLKDRVYVLENKLISIRHESTL